MSLAIITEFLDTTGMTEEQITLELACIAYRNQTMSFGKARAYAGMSYLAFNKELADRNIYMHYDENDLAHDLKVVDRIMKRS